MSKSRSVPPGGQVVTERKLSKAFETYSAQVVQAVKLIEDRQEAFENEVRLALLAVQDDTAKQVADALAAYETRKRWWRWWQV